MGPQDELDELFNQGDLRRIQEIHNQGWYIKTCFSMLFMKTYQLSVTITNSRKADMFTSFYYEGGTCFRYFNWADAALQRYCAAMEALAMPPSRHKDYGLNKCYFERVVAKDQFHNFERLLRWALSVSKLVICHRYDDHSDLRMALKRFIGREAAIVAKVKTNVRCVRCVRKIQAAFRLANENTDFLLCRKRLLHEYEELVKVMY